MCKTGRPAIIKMSRSHHGASDTTITSCTAQDEINHLLSLKPTTNHCTGKRTQKTRQFPSTFGNVSNSSILADTCLTSPSGYQILSKTSNIEAVVHEYPSRDDLYPFVPDTPSFWPQPNLFPPSSLRSCHGASSPRQHLSHNDGLPIPRYCLQDIEVFSGDTGPSKRHYEDINCPPTSGSTRSTMQRAKRSTKAEKNTMAEDRCGGQLSSTMSMFSASINNPFHRLGDVHLPEPSFDLSHIQYGPLISATKQVAQDAGHWCNRPVTANGAIGIASSASYYEDNPTRRRRPSLSLESIRTRPLERSTSGERFFIIEIDPPSYGHGSPQTSQFESDLEVVQPSLFRRLLAVTSTAWTQVSRLCIVRHISRRSRRRIQWVVVLVTVVGAPTSVSVLSKAGTNSLVTTGVVTAVIAFGKFLYDRLEGSASELNSDMIFAT